MRISSFYFGNLIDFWIELINSKQFRNQTLDYEHPLRKRNAGETITGNLSDACDVRCIPFWLYSRNFSMVDLIRWIAFFYKFCRHLLWVSGKWFSKTTIIFTIMGINISFSFLITYVPTQYTLFENRYKMWS